MIGLGENITIGGTAIYVPDDSFFLGQLETQRSCISLADDEQRYLEQLNLELLYARKAYFGFVNHLRRVYDAPESEWVLNNINIGFERVQNTKNGKSNDQT